MYSVVGIAKPRQNGYSPLFIRTNSNEIASRSLNPTVIKGNEAARWPKKTQLEQQPRVAVIKKG